MKKLFFLFLFLSLFFPTQTLAQSAQEYENCQQDSLCLEGVDYCYETTAGVELDACLTTEYKLLFEEKLQYTVCGKSLCSEQKIAACINTFGYNNLKGVLSCLARAALVTPSPSLTGQQSISQAPSKTPTPTPRATPTPSPILSSTPTSQSGVCNPQNEATWIKLYPECDFAKGIGWMRDVFKDCAGKYHYKNVRFEEGVCGHEVGEPTPTGALEEEPAPTMVYEEPTDTPTEEPAPTAAESFVDIIVNDDYDHPRHVGEEFEIDLKNLGATEGQPSFVLVKIVMRYDSGRESEPDFLAFDYQPPQQGDTGGEQPSEQPSSCEQNFIGCLPGVCGVDRYACDDGSNYEEIENPDGDCANPQNPDCPQECMPGQGAACDNNKGTGHRYCVYDPEGNYYPDECLVEACWNGEQPPDCELPSQPQPTEPQPQQQCPSDCQLYGDGLCWRGPVGKIDDECPQGYQDEDDPSTGCWGICN